MFSNYPYEDGGERDHRLGVMRPKMERALQIQNRLIMEIQRRTGPPEIVSRIRIVRVKRAGPRKCGDRIREC